MTAAQALKAYCFTSSRNWHGTIYEIADLRAEDMNGSRILAELVNGRTVLDWLTGFKCTCGRTITQSEVEMGTCHYDVKCRSCGRSWFELAT